MSPVGEGAATPRPQEVEGARKRAAVELFARYEQTLRRTARRYSMCADDVDDALQRALEILLVKAPSEDQRELIRWMQTVVKHEALAVRAERERILSGPAARRFEAGEDWVSLLPSHEAGPAERAQRSEAIARSREALQALRPQELRALSLLAEGYTYAEIGEITGFSRTKVNRCLAEGRERFRRFVARSEDGRRCAELGPLLSAFCDGEAPEDEVATLREHLRACSSCRATVRAYRAAPAAVAGLLPVLPVLPVGRSFLERAHQALADLGSRFGLGLGGGEQTASQVAVAGGTRGAGAAALAKVLAICAGAAGGAACVATGVAPLPLAAEREEKAPAIERRLDRDVAVAWREEESEPEPVPPPVTEPAQEALAAEPAPAPEPELEAAAPAPAAAEASPSPAPVAATPIEAAPAAASTSAGSAAGEFGP